MVAGVSRSHSASSTSKTRHFLALALAALAALATLAARPPSCPPSVTFGVCECSYFSGRVGAPDAHLAIARAPASVRAFAAASTRPQALNVNVNASLLPPVPVVLCYALCGCSAHHHRCSSRRSRLPRPGPASLRVAPCAHVSVPLNRTRPAASRPLAHYWLTRNAALRRSPPFVFTAPLRPCSLLLPPRLQVLLLLS